MKKFFLFGLIVSLIMLSCTQKKKSVTEGEWQMVYGYYGSTNSSFPDQITGSNVKMWTKNCFIFAGKVQIDTMKIDNFGWGKYKFIEGNKYEENIILHNYAPNLEGKTVKMLMELRNDTLIQRWPVDENWNLVENHSTEKYVRLK